MTLHRLKAAPVILIEDNENQNILPFIRELLEHHNQLQVLCMEQPPTSWRNVFKAIRSVTCFEQYHSKILEKDKSAVFIDSINQMCLQLGWNNCLNILRKLQKEPNIVQLVLVLHKDCLPHHTKLLPHLNHIASAIVSYSNEDTKISVEIKKSGKVIKSRESLVFDNKTHLLKCVPIVNEIKKENEPEKPQPELLSTFKIEVDGADKIQKSQLKLPYMSKIDEGRGKVYYEPDAVDDWDDEDPDDDLDI